MGYILYFIIAMGIIGGITWIVILTVKACKKNKEGTSTIPNNGGNSNTDHDVSNNNNRSEDTLSNWNNNNNSSYSNNNISNSRLNNRIQQSLTNNNSNSNHVNNNFDDIHDHHRFKQRKIFIETKLNVMEVVLNDNTKTITVPLSIFNAKIIGETTQQQDEANIGKENNNNDIRMTQLKIQTTHFTSSYKKKEQKEPNGNRLDDHDDNDDDDGQEKCSICMMDYVDGDEIAWSPNRFCNHIFHKVCITNWLLQHEECPYCRNIFLLSDDDNHIPNDDIIMESMGYVNLPITTTISAVTMDTDGDDNTQFTRGLHLLNELAR